MLEHLFRKFGGLFGSTSAKPTRTTTGYTWQINAALPFSWPTEHLSLQWLCDPSRAVQIKGNKQRQVFRITQDGQTYYLKRNQANAPRAWLRGLLRPPKAKLEFDNALRLNNLGFECFQPIGWAKVQSLWPGESLLLSQEVPHAVSLDLILQQVQHNSFQRRSLATALGKWFGSQHEQGVYHPDPHPGNILVRWPTTTTVPSFIWLDVHTVRFAHRADASLALQNLVLVNRWFQQRTQRCDRARFFLAYRLQASWCMAHPARTLAHTLETATLQRSLRLWNAKRHRVLGHSRQFLRLRRGSLRAHVWRDLPEEVWQEWLYQLDKLFTASGVVLLKDSPTSTVARLPGGYIAKRFRVKKATARLRNLFRPNAAERSWIYGHTLLARGLNTPRPVFYAQRTRNGIPTEGYVVFEELTNTTELQVALATTTGNDQLQIITHLAWHLRQMHQHGVAHRDLKASNILVSQTDKQPWLIDLVGVQVGATIGQAKRIRDLTRLHVSFRTSTIRQSLKLRFLLTYLPQQQQARWKVWWRAIAQRTQLKVSQNLRRGRPLV